MELRTPNLKLVLQSPEATLARIEAMPAEDRAQVSPDWLAQLRAATTPDPWAHGFALVHAATGDPVGSCGYKGPPDADGVVEIAYGIDPAHRNRGYATEAAGALTAHAFTDSHVRIVRVHTLPQANASTRVLTKCGFRHVGEIIDPEDGPVWRWEQHRVRALHS